MEEEQLRRTLDELDHEIETNPELALKERERLQHLAREIEDLLGEKEPPREHIEAINDRLEIEAIEFQDAHPALAETLNELLSILSTAGI
ncbi:MAG TPA: DUF4404 family protein [Anaerolineaceae bacterium]|nr:DUF4404 family protein [Anaerolineaceae bacterium]